MGLLDDAIREHLDLKRKRGADPSELTRDEQEALGPAVRQAPAEEPAAAPVAAETIAPADLAEDALPAEPAPAAEATPAPGLSGASEGAASGAAPGGAPAWEAAPETAPAGEVAAPPEAVPPAPEASPHIQAPDAGPVPDPEAPAPAPEPQETVAFDADDIFADDAPLDPATPPPEGEDVLEETPEFLQETPEHDRLWFEQKPPRDFDFDG